MSACHRNDVCSAHTARIGSAARPRVHCGSAEPPALEEAGDAGRELTRTETPHLDLVQLGARWRALTQASAAAALSLEAAQLAERQVPTRAPAS